MGEVVLVRPGDRGTGLNRDVLRREAVRPWEIDLVRSDRGRWCGRLAAGDEQESEEDGECRAEGMPGTRPEEEKHGGQRGTAAPAVARRTVQLKIRMKARRSSTSLTV